MCDFYHLSFKEIEYLKDHLKKIEGKHDDDTEVTRKVVDVLHRPWDLVNSGHFKALLRNYHLQAICPTRTALRMETTRKEVSAITPGISKMYWLAVQVPAISNSNRPRQCIQERSECTFWPISQSLIEHVCYFEYMFLPVAAGSGKPLYILFDQSIIGIHPLLFYQVSKGDGNNNQSACMLLELVALKVVATKGTIFKSHEICAPKSHGCGREIAYS